VRITYLTETREVGGAERHLADLAEGMARRGHEVTVLAPQPSVIEFTARAAPSARALRAFSDAFNDAGGPLPRAGALARELVAMIAMMRRLRPDVLHVNNGGFPGSDLCRLAPLAARLAGVARRVLTVHSNPWPRDHLGDPRVQAVADALVWPNVDLVVCPTQVVASALVELRGAPVERERLLRYGVGPPSGEDEAEQVRARLAPAGELLVGMVSARPAPEKGYDVFLEALARATGSVRGVLVGRYPEGYPERARAAGLDGALALEGLRRDVGAYYHAFDVLVVPSTAEECMPLVILEAAAAGTATFGSRLSGIPEAVAEGETGQLFAPGDAGALAALIDRATEERGRLERMGRAARLRWESVFTLDRMLAEHAALYARPG
jgi:glycosyltransferase involved in cell wall biosynthesis